MGNKKDITDKSNFDFQIRSLGECKIDSPVKLSNTYGDSIANYVRDEEHVLYDSILGGAPETEYDPKKTFERAGPRGKIFFNPTQVHAGVVTCGGLCPGLNDVIRSLVRTLWNSYGVRRISGIPYGYNGFLASYRMAPRTLTPDNVDNIHQVGGSILGSSRGGGKEVEEIVDAMQNMGMNMLFIIGGDGTQRGARDISKECQKRGFRASIVGVPKTIDNDIAFSRKTFGFETSVAKAVEAIEAAHVEATSGIDGIGLVKLMGRESGFIATQAALSSGNANFVLIPEVPFDLEGENGLFSHLKKRLERKHHAVIVVAEGAGQNLLPTTGETDKGGNKKLGDIGIFLKKAISDHFKSINMEVNLKYIDPSYMIRAAAPIPTDALYCSRLASAAVHAAMAGKTGMVVSDWNANLVHVPIEMVTMGRKYVDPESAIWRDVMEATSQPLQMVNKK